LYGVVLDEHFATAQHPSIQLEAEEEEAAVIHRHFRLLVKVESQELVPNN